MNAASDAAQVVCPECSAVCWIGSTKCWLCGQPLDVNFLPPKRLGLTQSPLMATAVDEATGAAGHRAEYQDRVRFQFGISSLLMLMTLTSVLFGLFSMAPGLGIAAMVLAVPALVPMCIIAMRKGSRGRPMTVLERTGVFLAWVGLMMIVFIAAGIAFFITCLVGLGVSAGTRGGGAGEEFALILAGIAALVVGVLMFIFFMRIVKF